MRLLAFVVLAGCFTAHRNAPGVADLSAPPRAGTRYLAPQPVGTTGTAVWVLPFFGDAGPRESALEVGGELRFERFGSEYNAAQLDDSAWAVAAGFVALRGEMVHGERLYAELQRRMTVSELIPCVFGAGIAFDEHAMPGIQASVHYLMLVLRARAHVDGAADLTFGFELPLAFLFAHSR